MAFKVQIIEKKIKRILEWIFETQSDHTKN